MLELDGEGVFNLKLFLGTNLHLMYYNLLPDVQIEYTIPSLLGPGRILCGLCSRMGLITDCEVA